MREPSSPSPILNYRLDHNWGLLREVPAMVLPRVRPQRLPMPLHSLWPRPQCRHRRLQQVPRWSVKSTAQPYPSRKRSSWGTSRPQAFLIGDLGSSGAAMRVANRLARAQSPLGFGSRGKLASGSLRCRAYMGRTGGSFCASMLATGPRRRRVAFLRLTWDRDRRWPRVAPWCPLGCPLAP